MYTIIVQGKILELFLRYKTAASSVQKYFSVCVCVSVRNAVLFSPLFKKWVLFCYCILFYFIRKNVVRSTARAQHQVLLSEGRNVFKNFSWSIDCLFSLLRRNCLWVCVCVCAVVQKWADFWIIYFWICGLCVCLFFCFVLRLILLFLSSSG